VWPVLEHLILAIFVADHYSQEDVIREEGEKRRPNELRGAGWKLPKSDRYTTIPPPGQRLALPGFHEPVYVVQQNNIRATVDTLTLGPGGGIVLVMGYAGIEMISFENRS